jgi:Sulfotransferase family
MKLFMQGMRRSGTTISFDILSQDPRLELWYEPFSQGKVGALGGGSGLQQVDLMEKIRAFRAEFCAARRPPLDPDQLNYGAPRDPDLELDEVLPDFCRDYLRAMTAKSEHSVFKFTRLYRKVKALREVAPDAKFVQLVRHPREVACSYMYGKDQKRAEAIKDAEAFFTRNNDANPWNSRKFFDGIVEREKLQRFAKCANFKRYLLLWKYTFEHTYRDGRAAFGDSFFLQRHEDILADPRGATQRLYDFLGLDAPASVLDWAQQNVRKSAKETYASDPRWAAAYTELGMNAALDAAGYGGT